MRIRRNNSRILGSSKWNRVTLDYRSTNSLDYRFDKTTGQVYTETTVPVQGGDDMPWEYRAIKLSSITNNSLTKKHKQNSKESCYGTQSLLLTAVETILANVSDLTLQLLELLPLSTVELLWNMLIKREGLSFHTWSLFSTYLIRRNSSTAGILRYRHTISSPKSLLETYIRALTSTTFDFITTLTITVPIPIPSLIQLKKLVNLIALEIIHNGDPLQSLVSDLLIRAWSLSASQENSFQILRILKLWNHREVTPKSLLYINHFPALAIYDIRGCDFNASDFGGEFGWSYQKTREPFSSFAKTETSLYEDTSWDIKLHQLCEKIGLVRDNIDLKRAGITLGDPFLHGDRMMSRLPIACLRLGQGSPYIVPHQPSWFSRIKLPDRNTIRLPSLCSLESIESNRVSKSSGGQRQLSQTRKKRRKIDDLLQEFT
ncbi:hypothetical protein K3495_g5007 [Podosphaera aphanis]|nr:hypothetical protein K3495_g5007 [Podosphaera aphanis]